MSEREAAEHMIFLLQEKAGLYAFAGNTAEVDKVQRTIAHLQSLYNVTSGVRREKDARTA